MSIVDRLANIDPSARVLTATALMVAALVAAVLWMSYRYGWSSQPAEDTYRPAHARRLLSLRQRPAATLTGRLKAELDNRARIWWDADTDLVPVIPGP